MSNANDGPDSARPEDSKSSGPHRQRADVAGRLLRRVAKASGDERTKLLNQLAKGFGSGPVSTRVFRKLLSFQPDGNRLACYYLSRANGPLSRKLLPSVLPLIKNPLFPLGVRISAAGTMIDSVRSSPESIGQIVDALTADMKPTRAVEVLVRLQSRTYREGHFQQLVTERLRANKLTCPRCRQQFVRSKLIVHLWRAHQLVYQSGRIQEPAELVEECLREAAKPESAADTSHLDRAFAWTELYFPGTPPIQVFQALAARGAVHPSRLGPLLERAARSQAGICPTCLTELPDPVPQLPAELSVTAKRLSGEGYSLELRDTFFGRSGRIEQPERETELFTEHATPRKMGMLMGLAAFVVTMLAVLGAIVLKQSPWVLGVGGVAVSWFLYWTTRLALRNAETGPDQLVNRAWELVVPGIGRRPQAVRFLIRLCRSSIGRGQPLERANRVWELAEQSGVLVEKSPINAQLYAASRVLQAVDEAAAGKELVSGLAGVFERRCQPAPGAKRQANSTTFLGDLVFAEAATEVILSADLLEPGRLDRLALLLIEALFEHGVKPNELHQTCEFSDRLRELFLYPKWEWLRALYLVWQQDDKDQWHTLGSFETIFSLVRKKPLMADELLVDRPDLLVTVRGLDLPESSRPGRWRIQIALSGVWFCGVWIDNPELDISTARSGRELWLGDVVIKLPTAAPKGLVARLQSAIRWWQRLMDKVENDITRFGKPMVVPEVRNKFGCSCPLCGTESLTRRGQMGIVLRVNTV